MNPLANKNYFEKKKFLARDVSFGYQENYFAKKKNFCLERDEAFGYQKNYFAS